MQSRSLFLEKAHPKIPLVECLDQVLKSANGVAIWYGDDFADLEEVTTTEEFWKVFSEQVAQETSELYLKYVKK